MRILIVSATRLEVAAVDMRRPSHDVELLIAGVGMVATAAKCARALATARYDVALNLGVCGSFDPSLPLGTVVHVVSDQCPELGAEDGDGFLTLEQLGLSDVGAPMELVNADPPASKTLASLPGARGITVNTVHGRVSSIEDVVKRFHPQVESMEGAAFAYACADAGVRYAQVRAVSNVVERRNRRAWKMREALAALAAASNAIIDEL